MVLMELSGAKNLKKKISRNCPFEAWNWILPARRSMDSRLYNKENSVNFIYVYFTFDKL
jgi:hypothetical protein